MSILYWILLGLVAGAIAKFIMGGREGSGFVPTVILGIIGAFLGGFIGTQLGYGTVNDFDGRGLVLAVAGAVLILFLFRLLRSGKN